MKLVTDAKNWTKWWSIRFLVVSAFFQAIVLAYATLPQDWIPAIPEWMKLGFTVGALVGAGLSGVARVVQQSNLAE